jgi:hypothetical protein
MVDILTQEQSDIERINKMKLANMKSAKRSDFFKIDIDDFRKKIIPFGLNPKSRTKGFPADEDDQALIDHIKNGGTIPPLEINKTKLHGNEIYQLVSGHRRRAAILCCIDDGFEIDFIPILVVGSNMSEANMLARTMADSKNKHWTKSEKADACKRFVAWNWTEKKIADCIGDSIGTVRTLLTIAEGSEDIRKAIDEKEIPQNVAVSIIENSSGSISEQKEKLNEIKKEKESGKRTKTGQRKKKKTDRKLNDSLKVDNRPPKPGSKSSNINKNESILDDTCGPEMMSKDSIRIWYDKLKIIVEKSERDSIVFETLEIILGYNIVV